MDVSYSALAALTICAAVVAQEPAKPQPEMRLQDIPIPSDRSGADVLELTLQDAMRIGRANNLDLRADEMVPQEQRMSIRVEEAFFEPEFFGSISTGRATDPQRNAFQPSIKRETVSGQVGFRQRVVTGGSFELAFSPSRLRQATNVPDFPNRQYSSQLTASMFPTQ